MTISFREYSTVFTEVAEQTDLRGCPETSKRL